jgi:hypothetical protein
MLPKKIINGNALGEFSYENGLQWYNEVADSKVKNISYAYENTYNDPNPADTLHYWKDGGE